ncbi:MAG: hypothetical protein JO114_01075 [Planctomycetaceae bacterium]|jgi:hypothetical protein|nr:hypothetical protein [Planctomycetaceae bacterium]
MESSAERFVPKVHPASREVMADDPMTLCATPVAGDPDLLIRAVVQEYAWMGWNAEQIAALFRDPFYPMLHGLWRVLGEAGVRERIDAVFHRNGVFRFRSTVHEEPGEAAPELIQIGLGRPQEVRHGDGL